MATDADEDGYDHYDPVGLASIDPGWRALYMDPEGNPTAVALYGWGVFHHTVRDRSTGEVVRDGGNVIEGVVGDHIPHGPPVYFVCARSSDLIAYLPPGMGEPESSVIHELRQRKPPRPR